LELLNAQQSYLQALLAVAQARENRYANTVALFQALGRMVEPRAAGYDESLLCSKARNEQCKKEYMQPFPIAEKLSYATGLTHDVSKFLFVDKLLSRLDGIPYFVGTPWREPGETWCTKLCNHSKRGVPCPLSQQDWSED
jgi:hypothetical protein